MKILVACEESQTVCNAMRLRGHEAYSCDIQECSGGHPEWHILSDVIPLLNGHCNFTTMDSQLHNIPDNWDLIIAHPPCTYLSKAGACNMYVNGHLDLDRYSKAMAAKDFFLKILNADCPRIAVENPVPMAMIGLPHCSQSIQPYEFGHPYSKRTLLWLKGLPPLFATDLVPFYQSYTATVRGSKLRSKTFYGIAAAMADQWAG